jgi:transcriptional regulator with XRE-family HTH domain
MPGAALGLAIRRLRQARRITIEDLAHSAEMHPTYLSGIERGRRNPTWRKLCGLADALNVSVSTLAAEAEEEAVVARVARTTRERLRGRTQPPGMPRTRQQTPASARSGA